MASPFKSSKHGTIRVASLVASCIGMCHTNHSVIVQAAATNHTSAIVLQRQSQEAAHNNNRGNQSGGAPLWNNLQRHNRNSGNTKDSYEWVANANQCATGAGEVGALLSGYGCQGAYCGEPSLYCRFNYPHSMQENENTFVLAFSQFMGYVSTDRPPLLCPDNYFISSLACNGYHCDFVGVTCSMQMNRVASESSCSWSDWVSEEGTGQLLFPENYFARGIECRGLFCDDKRFWTCSIVTDADADGSMDGKCRYHYAGQHWGEDSFRTLYPDDWLKDRHITSLSACGQLESLNGNDDNISLEHSEDSLYLKFFDESDNRALMTGFRLSGGYSSISSLICQRCDCTYPVSSSYWTAQFSEEDDAMHCGNDHFVTGITEGDNFSDTLALQCTYNQGRTSGTDCMWTEWYSEESFDDRQPKFFPNGFYPRGMECRGRFCDEKRFWLCQSISDESVADCR